MTSIAIDARMTNSSGIGVYIQNLLPFLIKKYKIHLLGNPQELRNFIHQDNVEIIPAFSPIYSLKEQYELYKKIPACDIFWSPHYNVPVLPVAANKRVVTIHDTYHMANWNTLSLPQKIFAKYFLKAATKQSDVVITVSKFSKEEIIKFTGVSTDKVRVIYNGINHSNFNQTDMTFPYSRKGIMEFPEKYILYVGNVKPHKNLSVLIKAYSKLSEEMRSTYKLLIVGKKDGFITGDTYLTKLLNDNIQLKETIIFTGFVEDADLPKLYSYASLFVFPSLYEGFGFPPLEAMACGCPVIASSSASMPEICGGGAAYFNPKDSAALAELITKVLGSKVSLDSLIEKGFDQASKYNWRKAAVGHIKVFESALKNELSI